MLLRRRTGELGVYVTPFRKSVFFIPAYQYQTGSSKPRENSAQVQKYITGRGRLTNCSVLKSLIIFPQTGHILIHLSCNKSNYIYIIHTQQGATPVRGTGTIRPRTFRVFSEFRLYGIPHVFFNSVYSV
jgi:hypothetical protein